MDNQLLSSVNKYECLGGINKAYKMPKCYFYVELNSKKRLHVCVKEIGNSLIMDPCKFLYE